MKRYLLMLCILAGLLTSCHSDPGQGTGASSEPRPTESQPPASTSGETIAQVGGWREESGVRRYYFADGTYAVGPQLIDGQHYYFHDSGAMQTGWVTFQNNRYYYDSNGVLQIGWLTLEGNRYFLAETVVPYTGWMDRDGLRYYFNSAGIMQTGWIEVDNHRYYLDVNGIMQIGWIEFGGKQYYLGSSGIMHTGWLSLDGKTYYLKPDGSMARGVAVIDGVNHYFTSAGQPVTVVNPWNFMPSDYEVNLKYVDDWHRVDASCYDALMQMLADCRTAGFNAQIRSSYRTQWDQEYLYANKVQYYLDRGYGEAEAKRLAGTVVAVPGTSEHQLGLAVDLVDNNNWSLDESQEDMPAQKWLMQNSWRYGFILRYPSEKSEYTGIIYEPWHYRYVGTELAKELYDSGLCLEEYLAALC